MGRRRRKGNEKLKKGAGNSEMDIGLDRGNPKPDGGTISALQYPNIPWHSFFACKPYLLYSISSHTPSPRTNMLDRGWLYCPNTSEKSPIGQEMSKGLPDKHTSHTLEDKVNTWEWNYPLHKEQSKGALRARWLCQAPVILELLQGHCTAFKQTSTETYWLYQQKRTKLNNTK